MTSNQAQKTDKGPVQATESASVTLDATGARMGRIATKAAVLLMGKNTPAYRRNIPGRTIVTIENVAKMDIVDKKKRQKSYVHYSGYPSGLKRETMNKVIVRKGYGEVLRRAVYGMLPKNSLRDRMIKNLRVVE